MLEVSFRMKDRSLPSKRDQCGRHVDVQPTSATAASCPSGSLLAAVAGIQRLAAETSRLVTMAEIVLRVRLTGGDHLDVTYEEPRILDEDDALEHVISALAEDAGILRCKHGDRLLVLYGRGVAALEVAPSGAVL